MGYELEQVSSERLRSIFEAAFLDCESDGESEQPAVWVGIGDSRVLVQLRPAKRILTLAAFRKFDGTRTAALELCNRINAQFLMVRAAVTELGFQGGAQSWLIALDHDHVFMDGERLEPRTLVRLVQRFERAVTLGLALLGGEEDSEEGGAA